MRREEIELELEIIEKTMDMLSSCCDYEELEELEKQSRELTIELYRLDK